MGHSTINVMLGTYGHLFEGADESAIERLDAFAADGGEMVAKSPSNVVELGPR
jgi:hypothetical protein